jgi:hypothetical protein
MVNQGASADASPASGHPGIGSHPGGFDNRLYHLEAMLSELWRLKNIGDTRVYLSLDCGERVIINELLEMAIVQRRCQLTEEQRSRRAGHCPQF